RWQIDCRARSNTAPDVPVATPLAFDKGESLARAASPILTIGPPRLRERPGWVGDLPADRVRATRRQRIGESGRPAETSFEYPKASPSDMRFWNEQDWTQDCVHHGKCSTARSNDHGSRSLCGDLCSVSPSGSLVGAHLRSY